MNRLATAVATGVISAATALAIVWVITFIRDASFIDAVRQPRFWLVEGAVMAIAVFVVLSKSSGDTATTRSPMRRVAESLSMSPGAQSPPSRSGCCSQSQPTPQSGNS